MFCKGILRICILNGISMLFCSIKGRFFRIPVILSCDILFAKHSQLYHPERLKDPSIYEVWCKSTHPGKTLDRQIKEGHFIATSKANILMNSRTEWHQPSVNRVTASREVRETNSGRGRGRVRGG